MIIMIQDKPTVIDQFNEQDKIILNKTKPENRKIVKDIIADYGLSHPLKPFFDNFRNDYDKLKAALEEFSRKRQEELNKLTQNL